MGFGNFPAYSRVRQWCQEYGRVDVPDDRGCRDFIDCETREQVRLLQGELTAMAEGKYDEKVLDQLVGVRRRTKYGSYQSWAKSMLQWLAASRS